MSETQHQVTTRYENCIAKDHARVQYGHTFVQSQYVTYNQVADGKTAQNGQRVDLVEALQFEHMDSRIAGIDPAVKDTCSWMFETTEYIRWRDPLFFDSHHGFLWVKGKAGSGKSTIMKRTLEHAENHYHNDTVVSFFFHARGYALEKTVEGMYRSLLVQLLRKLPYLRQKLPTYGQTYDEKHGWPIALLRNHLSDAVRGLESDSAVSFYIDALDECNEDDIREAIQHFEELGEARSAGGRIRICFASRYYPHITIQYSEEIRLDEQSQHDQDIFVYVRSKLRISDPRLKRKLITQIISRSSGVFLWVVLIVRILRKEVDQGTPSTRLLAIMELVPSQIQELLADIIHDADQALLAVMQWVLFTARPLRLEELYFAVQTSIGGLTTAAWDTTELTLIEMRKFVLNTSRGLVEIIFVDDAETYSTVQLIHESVKEYLLSDGLKSMDSSLGQDAADVALTNANIAMWCRMYLELDTDVHIHGEDPTDLMSLHRRRNFLKEKYPLLEYVIVYFFKHAEAAWQNGHLDLASLCSFPTEAFVKSFNSLQRADCESRCYYNTASLVLVMIFSKTKKLAEAFLTMLSPSSYDNGRATQETLSIGPWPRYDPNANCGGGFDTLLGAAIAHGYGELTIILLKHGADVNKVSGYFDTPLISTVRRYQHAMLNLLLERGADADGQNQRGRTALMEAIQVDDPHSFIILLRKVGADPNIRDRRANTALHFASIYCQEGMAQELLRRGAFIDAFSQDEGTPLMAASLRGNTRAVWLLLYYGADVNIGSTLGTALSIAATEGHTKVVQLLLDSGADVNAVCLKRGTALIAATMGAHESIVELLLEHGADPNAVVAPKHGTALGAALQMGSATMSTMLREYGADPDRTTAHWLLFWLACRLYTSSAPILPPKRKSGHMANVVSAVS